MSNTKPTRLSRPAAALKRRLEDPIAASIDELFIGRTRGDKARGPITVSVVTNSDGSLVYLPRRLAGVIYERVTETDGTVLGWRPLTDADINERAEELSERLGFRERKPAKEAPKIDLSALGIEVPEGGKLVIDSTGAVRVIKPRRKTKA